MASTPAFKKIWKALMAPLSDSRGGAAEIRPAIRGKDTAPNVKRDANGIALFMVIAAISVLSILVTEFTYVAQLNQSLAFDSLDQVKAHYLAKSGLKLSLLRLKAYQIVKGITGGDKKEGSSGGGGGIPGVPKALLDKIWSFPFIYPIPTNIPGLTMSEKDMITKFQKASGLEGSFSSVIDSESSRLNLNMILAGFGPPEPSPSPSPSPSPTPGQDQTQTPTGSASPSPTPTKEKFKPEEARKSLADYLQNLLNQKFESDPDLASEYRDFRMEDFMDTLVAWADPTYERRLSGSKDSIPMKRAPFYSVTELHMLPGMDDQLYEIFAPALTVSRTPGINLNTMQEPTLRAIVPQINDEEVKEFFKFRDNTEEDNTFKKPEDFFTYLGNSVVAFQRNEAALNKLKEDLTKRNIRLVVDENEFKITVRAEVNKAVRVIEAWVSLQSEKKKNETSKPAGSGTNQPSGATPSQTDTQTAPDSGLKINFMRIS